MSIGTPAPGWECGLKKILFGAPRRDQILIRLVDLVGWKAQEIRK